MQTLKSGVLLFLCLSWLLQPSTCSAETMYRISESQLSRLEANNRILKLNNAEQLKQLSALKEQVKILRQELNSSKEALGVAQQSLNKMKVYTEQLEKAASHSPNLMLGVGYSGANGYMLGAKYKINRYVEAAILGNNKSLNAVVFLGL